MLTEIERKALLGDKEAQKECTEKGILLPCPFCYGKNEPYGVILKYANTDLYAHKRTGRCVLDGSMIYNISDWNTRPAPPIGRCGECKEYDTENCSDCCGWCLVWDIGRFEDGFCNKFKPKEG